MSSPTTKDDKQVAAALAIRSVADSLKSHDSALKRAIEILSDPTSNSQLQISQARKALEEMNQSILSSAKTLRTNVLILDPIPSLNYAFSALKNRKSSPLEITNTAKRSSTGPAPAPKRIKTVKGKSAIPLPQKTKPFGVDVARLPVPQNGTVFSKIEVVEILKKEEPASLGFKKLVTELEKKVPVKRRAFNRLLEGFHKDGYALKGLYEDWGVVGRKAVERKIFLDDFLDDKDVVQVTGKMQGESGHCFDNAQIKTAIVDVQKEKMDQRGSNTAKSTGPAPAPKRSKTVKGGNAPSLPPSLPKPENGEFFSKMEVVEILGKEERGSKSLKRLVTEVEKHVPVQRRSINRLMVGFHKDGYALKGLTEDWGTFGRKPLLDSEDINQIVRKIKEKSGYCFDDAQIKAAIVDTQKESMANNGIQLLSTDAVAPCATTIRNYKSLIASWRIGTKSSGAKANETKRQKHPPGTVSRVKASTGSANN